MLEVQLLSGRADVTVQQIHTRSMSAFYNANKYKLARQLVLTLNSYVNLDLFSMLLEDFKYLCALIDKDSWPEGFRTYEWRCAQPFHVDVLRNMYLDKPSHIATKPIPCKRLNTEEVRDQRIITDPFYELPEGYKWPTVLDWVEANDLEEQYGQLAQDAMWIDSDLSIADTLKYTSMEDLMGSRQYQNSLVNVRTVLKCAACVRRYTDISPLNPIGFFRTNSDKAMMDMSLNLTSALDSYIPDDMPIKKFLYWYSCYVKDKNEAEEARRLAEAKKRG